MNSLSDHSHRRYVEDELFSRLGETLDERSVEFIPPANFIGPMPAPSPVVAPVSKPEPTAAPPFQPGDVQALQEWLTAECQRLAEYTNQQFAIVQQQEQALVQKRLELERAMAAHMQEISRQQCLAAHRAAELDQREQELATRDYLINLEYEQFQKERHQLQALQEMRARLEAEVEEQKGLAERMRAETIRLGQAHERLQAEIRTFQEDLQKKREAFEKEQAAFAAQRGELDRRLADLERGELSVQRRLAELDEMEAQLMAEKEEWEKRKAESRARLEQILRDRKVVSPAVARRDANGERNRQLSGPR